MENDRVFLALKLVVEFGQSWEFKSHDLAKLFKDAEQCTQFDHCLICSIAGVTQIDPWREEHHIAGRPNFPDTVTVCRRCHARLSDYQKNWLVHRKEDATRFSAYLFGWADFFDLISNKSGLSDFEKLASRFRAQGYYIRNRLHERRYLTERRIVT
jgi:hypothetical protein